MQSEAVQWQQAAARAHALAAMMRDDGASVVATITLQLRSAEMYDRADECRDREALARLLEPVSCGCDACLRIGSFA